MRVRNHRMQKLAAKLDTLPLQAGSVQVAFRHFCETGELPGQQRLAAAVADRAMGRPDQSPTNEDPSHAIMRALHIEVVTEEQLQQRRGAPPTVRGYVFYEAVYATGIVREAARAVLWLGVRYGADVTDPAFLADHALPDHAGVGLHLLGYPECLAKPPYVKQAHRLFERYRGLRARIDSSAKDWFQPFEAAIRRFEEDATLPANELVMEVVLANAEQQALWDHRRGRDVTEWMGLLDAAARAKGRKLADALAKVQDYARKNGLMPAAT